MVLYLMAEADFYDLGDNTRFTHTWNSVGGKELFEKNKII